MLIRDAQAGDFEAIAAITNPYILTTAIHFAYEPQTVEELRAGWEQGRGVYPFVVMVDDKPKTGKDVPRVVGYAKANRWRERKAYDRTAEVGIYLLPRYCGKGLGTRLYRDLIEECRGCGMHSLMAGATLPNPASVRLHESLGFVSVGVVREAGWKFEAWHDVEFWQLML